MLSFFKHKKYIMRALGVLSPSLAAKLDDEDKYILELDSLKIPLALIQIPDTEFDENDDNYSNVVLVKKKGFKTVAKSV